MHLRRRLRVAAFDVEDKIVEAALKIAFASSDMQHVNQHFGSAESFVIYAVDLEQTILLEVAQFDKYEQDGNEDKLQAKIDLLEGCTAVYCQAVGASAIRQLQMKNIQPVKVSEGADIKELVAAFQDELRAGPSAWLAKAIERQKLPERGRFDDMAAEEWNE